MVSSEVLGLSYENHQMENKKTRKKYDKAAKLFVQKSYKRPIRGGGGAGHVSRPIRGGGAGHVSRPIRGGGGGWSRVTAHKGGGGLVTCHGR